MSRPVHPIITQLRTTREERGLSRNTISTRIGWALYSVLQWEHGRRSPRLEAIADYADALGYDLTLTPKEDQ